jgi:hypothetical protein
VAASVFQLEDLLRQFRRKKVLTKQELLDSIGCSNMTLWKLLSRHGYYTSYNDNARHYTIDGIPKFDERGLWAYRGTRFSKWGTLTDTVTALVEESPSGLTAEQLQKMLGVSVKSILPALVEKNSLVREKIEHCFVYFSTAQVRQKHQRRERRVAAEAEQSIVKAIPLEHVVALLVEIIKAPRDAPSQWVRRLSRKGVPLDERDVQRVLDHYRLDPKKGLLKS